MASLEFVGQSARDSDNRQAATSRLINLYREPINQGTKALFSLKSVLGQQPFAELNSVFLRAMAEIDGVLYVAAGGQLYSVDAYANVNPLGLIDDSPETTISGNFLNVTICAGGKYYVYDGDTISQPASGAFSDFGSVTFIGNYTVLTERNGRRIQWSDIADAATLPGLNFATTEARDDDNLRAMPLGGNLWVFKKRSIEIWYITGQSGANAIKPVRGSVIDTGLKAFGLVTKFPRGGFFVGDDGIAYMTDGVGAPSPVSTIAVETALKEETPTHCFYYEDEGHKFCVIRFAGRPSWCFDIATGEWHERAEGPDHSAWATVATVKAYEKWLSGGDLGKINQMVRNNLDAGYALRRTAVSNTLSNEQRHFILDLLEFTGRFGRSDLGRDAQCWIRVSRDMGETWGEPKTRSWGAQGQYDKRVRFRGLGQFIQATVELNMSDPTDIPINSIVTVKVS